MCGGERSQGLLLLPLKLLQTFRQFGVAARSRDGQGKASQRVRDGQSTSVPFVQDHRRLQVTQRTRPHLDGKHIRKREKKTG